MASTTSSSSLPLPSSSSTLVDGKTLRPSAVGVTFPPPPLHSRTSSSSWKPSTYCRKIVRNVAASMATGEAPADVAGFETPEIVKTVQEYWDKLDDKYAVSSLVVAAGVGLWASTGVINAIDKLPLVPGVLELVGIGYTGFFAYKNLIFKPERDALIQKVKDTYKEIIGSN
uniref:Cyanobacterial aminoacyl-tRNA synthetase CAAD domain-containing protein n=1 Tax=Kalanchoe fedtschenkoi TaxID=63787 RepID=A0A7N0UZY4_KALFE